MGAIPLGARKASQAGRAVPSIDGLVIELIAHTNLNGDIGRRMSSWSL